MKGKKGSGRGWILLGKKRDGRFVMQYLGWSSDLKTWGSTQHRLPSKVTRKIQAETYADEYYRQMSSARKPPPGGSQGEVAASANHVGVVTTAVDPKLSDLMPRWLQYREELVAAGHLRDSVRKQDKTIWGVHVAPALGDKLLSELLPPPAMLKFFEKLAPGRANYTRRNVYFFLQQALDDIQAHGWAPIMVNPMRTDIVRQALPTARTVAGKKAPVLVDCEWLDAVYRSPDVRPDAKLADLVGLTGGLRAGEAQGLQVSDVHLDDEVPWLSITKAYALISTKGKPGIQDTKTEDGHRKVPLHPLTAAALRWWLKTGWEMFVGRAPKDDDYVLPTSSGKPWRPKAAARLRRDLRKAKQPDTCDGHPITFHALRRTFSTLIHRHPRADAVKGDLMGHAAKTVDQAHYLGDAMKLKLEVVSVIKLMATVEEIATGFSADEDEHDEDDGHEADEPDEPNE